jgi:hypothetical protein
VIYLDAELDEDEFMRRSFMISRGLGLDAPPWGLYYWRLPGSLAVKEVREEALAVTKECRVGLSIFDSLTVGSYGIDPKEARDVLPLMKGLEEFGAMLAIDHIRAPDPGENPSAYRPFGSTFKYNLGRSQIRLTQALGGGLALRQNKANFSAASPPIYLALHFEEREVKVIEVEPDDPRLAGVEEQLSATERVAHALATSPNGTATIETLASTLDLKEKTIRNHLSALHARNRAEPLGDGRWSLKRTAESIQK